MPPDQVRAVLPLLREQGRAKELIEATQALMRLRDGQSDFEMTRMRYEAIRDDLGQPNEARQFLVQASQQDAADRLYVAQVLGLLARFDLELARDPVRALESIQKVYIFLFCFRPLLEIMMEDRSRQA